MLNVIVEPGCEFAEVIVARSEPVPELAVVVTVKVEGTTRVSRASRRGR
jgi:hypothetical protein